MLPRVEALGFAAKIQISRTPPCGLASVRTGQGPVSVYVAEACTQPHRPAPRKEGRCTNQWGGCLLNIVNRGGKRKHEVNTQNRSKQT